MSYDLYLWRQADDARPSPAEVMSSLANGERPFGVEEIPISSILARLRVECPEILENHTEDPEHPLQLIWDNPDGGSTFLLDWSTFYICVEGHGVSGEVFNRIIDILLEFGCPLYDPQTDTRYVGEES